MKVFSRILLLLFIVVAGVLFFILNPEEYRIFPKCIFHSTTGYYCPGCGSQRAIHNLLHLNFGGAAGNNLLLIAGGLLIVYHYSHSFFNRKFGWHLPNVFYLKATPWILFSVIILFWILRNIPVYPFTLLAPA